MSVEKVGLEYTVDDKASAPLSKIEKSYISITKSMNKAAFSAYEANNKLNYGLEKMTDAIEEAGEAEEEQIEKLDKTDKSAKKLAMTLHDKMTKGFLSLKGALVGLFTVGIFASVIAFFKEAVETSNEFARAVLPLNEALSMTSKQMAEVGGSVAALTGYAGKTRDEVIGLHRELLELGIAPGLVKGSFRELAKTALDLSAATGVAAGAAAGFIDEMIHVNQIPSNQIRGVGNAIKYVADQFRVTSDELLQFNKTLTPIFAHLKDKSGDARAKFTVNMMGLVGALKQVNVDANKVTGQFGDMLNVYSMDGQHSLGMLANVMKKDTGALREMIKTNPAKMMDELAKTLSGMDAGQLQLISQTMKPLNLSFEELTELAEKGHHANDKGAKSFERIAEEAAEAARHSERLAESAKKRQSALDGYSNAFKRMWESIMLTIGSAITKNLIKPFMEEFIPLVREFANWVKSVPWDAVFKKVADNIRLAVSWFVDHKDTIFEWAKYIGMIWVASKGFAMVVGLLKPIVTIVGWFVKLWPIVAGIGKFLLAFSAPILLTVVAVAAVGAAVYKLHEGWDDLVLNLTESTEGIRGMFGRFADFLKSSWTKAVTFVQQWFSNKIDAMADDFNWLFDNVIGAERWASWKKTIKETFESLYEFAQPFLDKVSESFAFIGDIITVLKGAKGVIKDLWSGKIGERIAENLENNPYDTSIGATLGKAIYQSATDQKEVKAGAEEAKRGPIAKASITKDNAALANGRMPSFDMPSSMVTTSPGVEKLLSELVTLNQKAATALATIARGKGSGGPSAARHGMIEDSAG